MLKNRIIPCLDVKNGRVVKGINFVDLKDAGDPVEQAKIYSDGGADEICFLDITASNEKRDIIYDGDIKLDELARELNWIMVAKLLTIKRKIKNGDKLGFSERARAINKGLLPSKAKKRKNVKK